MSWDKELVTQCLWPVHKIKNVIAYKFTENSEWMSDWFEEQKSVWTKSVRVANGEAIEGFNLMKLNKLSNS